MRAKLDENMPIEAVELFVDSGWTCDTVYDEGLGGATDDAMGRACQTEGRGLFTLDLDFADIRRYSPGGYPGIVVLRPATPSRRHIVEMVARLLPVLAKEWQEHQLWIVEPGRVRVRESGIG